MESIPRHCVADSHESDDGLCRSVSVDSLTRMYLRIPSSPQFSPYPEMEAVYRIHSRLFENESHLICTSTPKEMNP